MNFKIHFGYKLLSDDLETFSHIPEVTFLIFTYCLLMFAVTTVIYYTANYCRMGSKCQREDDFDNFKGSLIEMSSAAYKHMAK